MAYTLGTHVRRHNNRLRNQQLATAGALAYQGARAVYDRLPSFSASENRLASRVVRLAHEERVVDVIYQTLLTNAASSWNSQLLNGLFQGSTAQERTGREISLESFDFIGFANNTSSNTGDVIRFVVFRDKECRGAVSNPDDLFARVTGGTGVIVWSPYNYDNVKRFDILYDSGPIVVEATTAGAEGYKTFKFRVMAKSRPRYYVASNNGDVTDIDTGAVYIVGMSVGNVTDINLNIRMHYRDM